MASNRFEVSRSAVLGILSYPTLFLVLYFSLALHLRYSLGAWPNRIGASPGTPSFHFHDSAACLFFWVGTVLVPVSGVAGCLFALFPGYRKAASRGLRRGAMAWVASNCAPIHSVWIKHRCSGPDQQRQGCLSSTLKCNMGLTDRGGANSSALSRLLHNLSPFDCREYSPASHP